MYLLEGRKDGTNLLPAHAAYSVDDIFLKEELIIVIMRSAINLYRPYTNEDLKREQECIMGELNHGVKVVKVDWDPSHNNTQNM